MRSISLMITLLVSGLLYGCGGSGSTAVSYKQTPMAVFVYGSVVDAKTNSAGVPANVTVTGATVYSQSGAVLPATFATDAKGQFAISLAQVPTEDTNLVFATTASGYVVNNYTLTVKKDPSVRIYQFQIPLVALTAPPAGVTVSPSQSFTDNGSTKVVATTPISNGATITATLQPGTILKDASGATLSSLITMTATSYDSNAGVGSLAPNSGSLSLQASFLSAGFTDITVKDSNGRIATTIDPATPLKVRMDLADGTLNPNTGRPFSVTDAADLNILTIYTFNKSTGAWDADSTSVPVTSFTRTGGTVGWYVEFTATHFSYWSLGYRGAICPNNITIGLIGTNPTVPLTFSVKQVGLLPGAVFNTQTLLGGIKPAGDNQIILKQVPKTTTPITVSISYAAAELTTATITNCVAPATVSINPPVVLNSFSYTVEKVCTAVGTPQKMANVTVYSCPNGTTTLPVPPTPTCDIIGVTNSLGVAIGSAPELTGVALPRAVFVAPNGTYTWPYLTTLLPSKLITAGALTQTVDYTGTWDFCSVTGGNVGTVVLGP
jgi:hypothetical protein